MKTLIPVLAMLLMTAAACGGLDQAHPTVTIVRRDESVALPAPVASVAPTVAPVATEAPVKRVARVVAEAAPMELPTIEAKAVEVVALETPEATPTEAPRYLFNDVSHPPNKLCHIDEYATAEAAVSDLCTMYCPPVSGQNYKFFQFSNQNDGCFLREFGPDTSESRQVWVKLHTLPNFDMEDLPPKWWLDAALAPVAN